MYINRAIIYGNITKDPELRSLPSGMKVCSFSVATNRVYKDAQGQKQEQADFHNIVVFGKQAELVAQYMKKGSAIFVEGRIQTRSWDGQDGQKKYKTEIVAERVQFGPKRGDSGAATPKQDAPPAKDDEISYPQEQINPDDIPF